MSLAMYLGMVTGILAALLAMFIGAKLVRRQPEEVEDERVVQVKAEASGLALKVSGGIAFIGWVADNLLAYYRGEAIHTLTPWSILLLVMVGAYTISLAYYMKRYSADGDNPATRTKLARTLGANVLVLASSAALLFQGTFEADPGLKYLMIGLYACLLASVVWLLVKLRRQEGKMGGQRA